VAAFAIFSKKEETLGINFETSLEENSAGVVILRKSLMICRRGCDVYFAPGLGIDTGRQHLLVAFSFCKVAVNVSEKYRGELFGVKLESHLLPEFNTQTLTMVVRMFCNTDRSIS